MTDAINKLNLFSSAPAIKGVQASPAKAVHKGVTTGTSSSNNPFKGEKGMGVGLVNSELSGLSYTLPNGKTSKCNTIGIA